jgi:hypothetical protein
MKFLRSLLIFIFCFRLSAFAVDVVTATVTFTNSAGTTNGQTITINSSVRTWTNSVSIPASQILTNSTATGAATNLFSQIALTPIANLSLGYSSPTGVTLRTFPGVTLTVTLSAGYAAVTYSTNTLTPAIAVRVPYTVEGAAQRTNISSELVNWLNLTANTNQVSQTSTFAAQLVGLTNSQTITGNKTWTGSNFFNNVSLSSPRLTNAASYGSATAENIDITGNLTFNGSASTIDATGDYFTFQPESGSLVYLGTVNGWEGLSANNAYLTNSLRASNTFTTNLTVSAGSTFTGTNSFSDLSFRRFANTTLATGNNAGVLVGTNTFVEVSGPSAAFTINGLNGSPNRDGHLVIILNQTGYNMTIAHDSGVEPTSANRIYTMTGADRATTANGAATLIYNANSSRWILIAIEQ